MHPVSFEIAQLAGKTEGEQTSNGIAINFEDFVIGATALHFGFDIDGASAFNPQPQPIKVRPPHSDKIVSGFVDGMNLILRRDVDSVLGRRGEVVQAAPEYARKHLLPKRLAVAANEANRKIVAQELRAFLRKDAKLKSQAQNLAAQLGDVTISISRVLGPNDVLIGPVTAGDIADALSARYPMDRRKILPDEPINAPGEHTVRIRLHRDVIPEIQLVIVALRESFSPERELLDEATRVFGDEATAREWVDAPIASLGGQRPGELFDGSPSDRQRIETILGRIECGIF